MNIDKIYPHTDGTAVEYPLANGYISTTSILFEAYGVAVTIDAAGSAAFFDRQESRLAEARLPDADGGKEKYTEVLCAAKNAAITLKFPIVEGIDNYPNCDGEHDRWDTRTIGYHVLTFDPAAHTVKITEEKR